VYKWPAPHPQSDAAVAFKLYDMSLRLRLILAFVAVVSLLGIVGVIALYINRGISEQVTHLTQRSPIDLHGADPRDLTLEIAGYWDKAGVFVATEIERLPGPRRPKVRGDIHNLDPEHKTLSMYGVTITVASETEFESSERTPTDFESLSEGQRAEVSCRVDEDGRWIARKIRVGAVKESDKIKGTVTGSMMDGVSPDTLEIAGVRVSIIRQSDIPNPGSQLQRVAKATDMVAAAQMCITAAQEVIHMQRTDAAVLMRTEDGDLQAPDRILASSLSDFENSLDDIQAATPSLRRGGGSRESAGQGPSSERVEATQWISSLVDKRGEFRAHVKEFLALAETDNNAAEAYAYNVLTPFLRNDVLPLVYEYRIDAEETLAAEVKTISDKADTTARLLLVTSIAAVVLALVLGILVWRSISRPLLALRLAAEKIGHGHLDTRVDVQSRDELGVLAGTLNQMAEELSATTVSMRDLNNVIDSMAGALIVIDDNDTIISINRAALVLLRYERSDLVGQPFHTICPTCETAAEPTEEGIVRIEERELRRKNGSTVPVSFSGAALRSEGGPTQGYVCVAQDLTDRKNIEEQIRRSLDEKELLLREVHHRVKNNLQVISSLLDLQSSYIENEKTLQEFRESQNRIRSMALIHEQLYRTTGLDRVDLRSYIELLAEHLKKSFGAQSDAVELRTDVEEAHLNIDQAMTCGLIINELITNAFQHAFPQGGGGEVLVCFRAPRKGTHLLLVSDNGRGSPEEPDPEKLDSLGMTLVSALVKQLRGNLEVKCDGGMAFRIEFPAEHVGEEAAKS
jgi:PAS domain S-box-containing protein